MQYCHAIGTGPCNMARFVNLDRLASPHGNSKVPEDAPDRRSSAQSWILPIVTALLGALAGVATAAVTRLNSNDLMAKEYVSMAVEILRLPAKTESDESEESKQMRQELRRWAVDVINSYAKVKMSPELARYLASANGKRLLLQIVDDSKTDTGVLVCSPASASQATLEFAKAVSSGIVASGDFGSSYVSAWKDEGDLTSSSMKGSIAIIKDKNHPEERSIPALKKIIELETKRSGISLPIVVLDNPSPKESPWYLSIVVCP